VFFVCLFFFSNIFFYSCLQYISQWAYSIICFFFFSLCIFHFRFLNILYFRKCSLFFFSSLVRLFSTSLYILYSYSHHYHHHSLFESIYVYIYIYLFSFTIIYMFFLFLTPFTMMKWIICLYYFCVRRTDITKKKKMCEKIDEEENNLKSFRLLFFYSVFDDRSVWESKRGNWGVSDDDWSDMIVFDDICGGFIVLIDG